MRVARWLLLSLLTTPAIAFGCDPTGQMVIRAMNTKVATYSLKGDYLKDVEGGLIATNVPVVACDDTTSHIEVRLTAGEPVWVDRLDVEIKTSVAPAPRRCKNHGIAKPDDQTAPATSGIDPCTP